MNGTGRCPRVAAVFVGLPLPILFALMPILALDTVGPLHGRAANPRDVAERICGYDLRIRTEPAPPAPADAVKLAVSGVWGESCVPTYKSHQIAGDEIDVDAVVSQPPGTACLTVLTPWDFTVDVGSLSRGRYAVDLRITNRFQESYLCGTEWFTVSDALITAVYYDTYLANEPDEAFRLMNISGSAMDLTGWTVTDGEGTVTLSGTLDSRQSIWIAREAAAFAQEFGFAPDYEYGANTDAAVPNLSQTGSFDLANDGDQVILHDSGTAIVDSVVYENGDPTGTGWSGSPIEPYGGASVGVERSALVGSYEAEGFGLEGQILYRKLDQATGLPEADSDNAFDWAQDPIDNIGGKKVQYPGWDLERYFFPKTFTEPASVTYALAPDHIYEAVVSEIEHASSSLYYEGYTFKNAQIAEAIVARMQANPGMTVKILLEGEPVGGIVDQQKWICQQIENAGGEVHFMHNDDAHDIHDRYNDQHGKWMIIDEEVLLTGSENLDRSSMPADDKSDGTEGNRGVWLITNAPSAVAHALDVFRHDLDPANHRDIIRWAAGHPTYGAPPQGFAPDHGSNGTTYAVKFPTLLTFTGRFPFEIVQSPENSLRNRDSLLGMVYQAGRGDTLLVQQMSEYPYWGPTGSNPIADPNPRLYAYIHAARRGGKVRIMLDSYSDEPEDPRSNVATCAYVSDIASTEGLDLACRRANPTGTGIHNNMILLLSGGKGYVHTGSINGTEHSSKNNREFAVQVQSDAAYGYLSSVFWHDWGAGMEPSTYLPLITHTLRPCAGPGEEICAKDYSQGLRCCTGLTTIAPARAVHPCETPGWGDCDMDGCTDYPNYCSQCTPCGNGICQPEYGENRCNCMSDCDA